ncbi:hypothetical protein SCB49_10687 [unidentified eubacterium SCB49]|nr:hypothetical protein SCB49_10687 [unidentified eubacterium SCB49]
MESAKITKLLEAYFEGETTLAQEKTLLAYFSGDEIDAAHEPYIPLFKGVQMAKDETMDKQITFPKQKESPKRRWWIGVAASAVIVLSVTGYMYTNANELTQEEQEAVMAFNQSKEAFLLLSKSFNKGAEELGYINKFTNTTNKYFK